MINLILIILIIYLCYLNIQNINISNYIMDFYNKYLKYKAKYIRFNECFENFNDDLNYIMNLTKEFSIYRPVESNNLNYIKRRIIEEMTKIGIKINVQKFTRNINGRNYHFSNLIGQNNNISSGFTLLGAHIDSPQIDGCQSSIDAATGIAINLMLTKKLLKIDPNYPIMLLFIDGEEAIDGPWSSNNTLSGSTYFADHYDLSLINKVYIIDLIGGDIEENKIVAFSNNKSTYNDLEKLSKINQKNFDKQIFINPNNFVSDNAIEDDHVPFVKKGKYSLNLIPYKFPKQHHKLSDTYDNVNWAYIEIFYKTFLLFLIN